MASRQAVTQLAFPVKRSILQTQAEERNRLLDEYFESTKLLQVVQEFMVNLATTFKTQLQLPANPYPVLLKTIRMHELRRTFALQSNSGHSSLGLAILSGQTATLPQFQVCSVEHEQFAVPVWGMKTTLEQLTGANLYGLLEQMNSAFRGLVIYKEFTDEDCRVAAYGVLVGDNIFGARLQDLQPTFLELEAHVFVSGARLEQAMVVFARFLLKQLYAGAKAAAAFESLPLEEAAGYNGCVVCDGISIAPQSLSTGVSAQDAVWAIDRVLENRSSFINAVKAALVSNSLITLNRYNSAKLFNSDGGYLCQIEQTYFFHFTMEDGSKPVKNSSSHRSFLVGSRVLASGLFFDSKGALEVAARFRVESQTAKEEEPKNQKKKNQTAVTATQDVLAIPETRSRPGFMGLLQSSIDELRRLGLTSEIFREQANSLVGYFAYSLVHLGGAHQVLESILCRPRCSAATLVKVHESYKSLESQTKRFLEESKAYPSTSMLHPVCSLISDFYHQVQAASTLEDERQINGFVEALRCVNELLLVVVRVSLDDFLHAAKTTVVGPTIQVEVDKTADEIDVPRALEMAVLQRKYPASIVSEAVFAQAVIDSCLDVAIESAVMNTVAVRLPPNPFIDMSINLQVFALRQLVWSDELYPIVPTSISKISSTGSLDLFSMGGTNACAVNQRLLEIVNGDQILQTYRWLVDHHVFYEGAYKPSKSSYSAAIFPTLLVFHPLLFARFVPNDNEDSSQLKEIDVVEHYALEGNEFALARSFFVEAVRIDLRRIAVLCYTPISGRRNCSYLRAEAQVLDLHANVLATFELSPLTTDEHLTGIIDEATQRQLLLQVVVQVAEEVTNGGSTILTIHNVTKAYSFHHQSTDDHGMTDSSTLLPPLLCFRMSEYGIFFSKENALLCLGNCPQGSEIPRDEWTPFASQALEQDDTLLIYELNIVHKGFFHNSSPQRHQVNELTNRLVGHSDICMLYSLEQAARWVVDALHTNLQSIPPSRDRKEESSQGLDQPKLFSIHHRFALQIVMQMEQFIVPLNHQLQFIHDISDILADLRKQIARWKAMQSPTEEQLEIQRKQRDKAPRVVPPTPREDQATIIRELVNSFRTTWILVLFFRFSYQRAFFANAERRRKHETEK